MTKTFGIPELLLPYKGLLKKNPIAVLATLMPNGYPQQTLVWFDFEGDMIRFNTVVGRQKDKNIQLHNKVSFMILDPEDYTKYLEIRGIVHERTIKQAKEHLDLLARKYLNVETYPYPDGALQRVTYKIKIEKIRPSTNLLQEIKKK